MICTNECMPWHDWQSPMSFYTPWVVTWLLHILLCVRQYDAHMYYVRSMAIFICLQTCMLVCMTHNEVIEALSVNGMIMGPEGKGPWYYDTSSWAVLDICAQKCVVHYMNGTSKYGISQMCDHVQDIAQIPLEKRWKKPPIRGHVVMNPWSGWRVSMSKTCNICTLPFLEYSHWQHLWVA
jgi:hypothetical protein